MDCKTCRAEIEDLKIYENLGEEAGGHLRVCAACRSFYDEQRALKNLLRELEVVSAPADFDFRLRARLAASKRTEGRRLLASGFSPGIVSITLATCFAIAAGIALYSRREAPVITSAPVTVASSSDRSNNPANRTPVVHASETDEEAPISPAISSRKGAAPRYLAGIPEIKHPTSKRAENLLTTSNTSYGFSPAPTPVTIPLPSARSNAGVNLTAVIPVAAVSVHPLRLTLRDQKGTPHSVTLEPITFGAQGPLSRTGGASDSILSNEQGVW